jgi:hypothetical protein
MVTISITWTGEGTPYSVLFGNSGGSYGVRRTDTMATVIVAGVALDSEGSGVYSYTFEEPAAGLTYEYSIAVVDEDGEPPVYIHGYEEGTAAPATLDFVIVTAAGVTEADEDPTLSNPHATYGVKRLDTNETVVAAAEAFDEDGGLYSVEFNEPVADLTYRYYIKAIVDEVTYYLPRTTAMIRSAALAIGRYTNSHNVEQQYGIDNVHKWCAIDDTDEAVDYGRRMYAAIAAAESEMDDSLRSSAYTIPFTAPIPAVVTEIATALAGVRMYEARGVTDFDPESGQPQHRLHFQKKEAWKRLAMIKAGQLRLDADATVRYPEVAENAED